MLLGFKKKFVEYVLEGSKTHTIRAIRTDGPRKTKAGEQCHCYIGLRQRGSRLLGRFPLLKIEEIRIDRERDPAKAPLTVHIAGNRLTRDEAEVFFHRDGFREPGRSAIAQAADFWQEKEFPWAGELIHWIFERK